MKLIKISAIKVVVIFVSFLATSVQAASFDCAKAASKIEKMTCADPKLSKLDEEMVFFYVDAIEYTADPAELKIEQRRWLKSRDTCEGNDCLAKAYRSRIAALQTILAKPKPCFRLLERKWPEVASGHYPVCVDLLKSMNTFCSDLPLCEWKVTPAIPSLALPQWEELDPKEHLKLIQHMHQTQSFFKAPEERWIPIPAETLQRINEGKTRLWRTLIDVDRDGQKEYVVRFHAGPCENKIDFYGTESRTNVADASLSRVDPRYSGLDGTDIVLHDDRAFVVFRSGHGFAVGEPFSAREGLSKGMDSVCVFEFLKQ